MQSAARLLPEAGAVEVAVNGAVEKDRDGEKLDESPGCAYGYVLHPW
jgi:hypothetical protein